MDTQPRYLDAREVDWKTWRPLEKAALCFIVKSGRVLLIHKKTGLGKGKINGPGGRIEEGESALAAAVRETEEEVGVTPEGLKKVAELSFIFTDGYSLFGEVFLADNYTGEPRASREADPFWCDLDKIPYQKMWEDDILWLPSALSGRFIRGYFIIDGDKMLSYRLQD